MLVEITYPIGPKSTVLDEGLKKPCVVPRSRIEDGDRSNTSYLEMFAHTGTHIDSPWHFHEMGRKIMDFEIQDFVFERVALLDIPKQAYQPIEREDLRHWESKLTGCDAVLFRSGFGAMRNSDPALYVKATPGLSTEAAQFLADLEELRCIGVDFISIENIDNARGLGYPVHHILLERKEPMFLLEDANLAVIGTGVIEKMSLFPIRMEGLEASPVTAVVEMRNGMP